MSTYHRPAIVDRRVSRLLGSVVGAVVRVQAAAIESLLLMAGPHCSTHTHRHLDTHLARPRVPLPARSSTYSRSASRKKPGPSRPLFARRSVCARPHQKFMGAVANEMKAAQDPATCLNSRRNASFAGCLAVAIHGRVCRPRHNSHPAHPLPRDRCARTIVETGPPHWAVQPSRALWRMWMRPVLG